MPTSAPRTLQEALALPWQERLKLYEKPEYRNLALEDLLRAKKVAEERAARGEDIAAQSLYATQIRQALSKYMDPSVVESQFGPGVPRETAAYYTARALAETMPAQAVQPTQVTQTTLTPTYYPKLEDIYPRLEDIYNRLITKIETMPRYQMPSEEELLRQAQEYAALEVDPRVQALERAIQERRRQAEQARAEIEAAYGAFEPAFQRRMEEARRAALESMIARGLGRSGLVEWYTGELQKPILEQQAQVEAERASKLADVTSQLGLAEQQYQEQLQQLAELRGRLESQRLQALRDAAYARATGDWERMMQAELQAAQLGAEIAKFPYEFALQAIQYTTPTWADLARLQREASERLGTEVAVPTLSTVTAPFAPVATGQLRWIREYLPSGTVEWDPATQRVLIEGVPVLSLEDVERYGGQVIGERVYLPPDVMDYLLSIARRLKAVAS